MNGTMDLSPNDTKREVDLRIRDLQDWVMIAVEVEIRTGEDMDMVGKIKAEERMKKAVKGFRENSQ